MYELHVHLDGSLRKETLYELGEQYSIIIPEKFGFSDGMGLDAALSMFQLTISLMQDKNIIERLVSELCDDLYQDGVEYAEIRYAPNLHGIDLEEIVNASCNGLRYGYKIILCGLYGYSPQSIETLVELAKKYDNVVGIDIAGGPRDNNVYGLHDYVDAFQEAKKYNIGRTVHVSEGRSPQEIIDAVLMLDAQRLGHACTILESPEAIEIVKDRNVVIEACPTSNVHTGIYLDVLQHPIKSWIKEEIPVTVCADNTLMSRTNTSSEISNFNFSEEELFWIFKSGYLGRFKE